MENYVPFIFITVAVALIFLVCRELMCWYWKMNRTVELLEEIAGYMRKSSQVEDQKKTPVIY